MKQVLSYILFFSLVTAGFAQSKKGSVPAVPVSFPDSVRIILENTRSVDAQVIGSGFISAWGSLGLDQQNLIQDQVRLMRKKKYSVKPHLLQYFGAIVNAVNIEKADATTLNGYLNVAAKVIETYDATKALLFFQTSRAFFQYHALHYEKSFRLYASDDVYTFDFIAPMAASSTLSWDDSGEEKDDDQESTESLSLDDPPASLDDPPASLDDIPYSDDTVAETQSFMPGWMTPAPPPYQEGPIIRFESLSLNFVTSYDSVFLKNSKGTFSFLDNMFVGDQGNFEWTPALLSSDSLQCTMTSYFFSSVKAELNAELVKLNYTGKTPGFIPGKFEYKSVSHRDSVASSFPRFISYQCDLKIQGVGNKNVSYSGGFTLTGNKVTSGCVPGSPSTVEVTVDGTRKFTARSTEFEFLDSAISSPNARVTIYQMNDSIAHPGLKFKFSYPSDSLQELYLHKERGSLGSTPYAASFFGMDFSADIIKWNVTQDSMDIQTEGGRNTVEMILESNNFYDADDYRLLKGVGFSFHPLALVANYCLKMHTREFYSGNLAQSTNKPPEEIKMAMEFLSEKGILDYNKQTDLVTVRPKAIEKFKAYKGDADYDNLKIHSVTDSFPNATLNIPKRYMTVRGVEEFKVSDSLNVRIEPDSSVITLLENRDIKFDGTINAGNFQISGKGFTLKYDSFYINLKQIDSINFYVTEKNSKGQSIRRKVNNSMVGVDSTAAAEGGLGDTSQKSGTLFISLANNKSGKLKVPNYPRLDASSGGVIYFDRKEVLEGAYDRSVFFVVPPFKLDSLNDADPASINFDGTFVSSGMFPSFKEKLHTMPDKSLGFEHNIPKPGYQLYNGDGKLNGQIRFDNRGIRSSGTIDFLAASASSPDFVFYPDSVIGRGNRAIIREEQHGDKWFPQASLPDYDMKWYPKRDEMQLKNLKAPFNFYDSTAQLRGTVKISKGGVDALGRLETRGTELISREIHFSAKDFGARNAKFQVKSGDPKKPLMYGDDIRLKFNLEENYADISPEIEGVAAIEFPFAQMKTSIPNARWDLTSQKITMTKSPDIPLENSYFYTTRKELDSLNFNAEKAEYDLKTQQLKVSGIPYIIVADARITPENNEVLILENSKIGTLKNTTIILDTLNAYHRLTEGVVDIISRNEFSGYATYQYVNLLKDTFAIKMTDFHLEPIAEIETAKRSQRKRSGATQQTVGVGSVADKDMMVLGAGMFYKGDITMYATRPALQLDGFVKLDIKKIKNYNTWIAYKQSGEEPEVLIDFDNAVNEDGRKVDAGLHFSAVDNSLYISFLSEKTSEDDEDLFHPSGTLHYDTASQEYKIEDLEKAAGNKLSGKVFAYNDNNSNVRFEGQVGLFNGTKDFSLTTTALGSGNLETKEIRLNSFIMMNSNIPTMAFELMARDIQAVIKNEGAEEGLGDQTELLYKIADILGERAVKDFEQRSLQGYVSLGTIAQTAMPLVFSNVNLKWSHEHKAFYSEGALGVSNILRNDINGAFEGFMEIKRSEDGGQIFNVFIKASPDSWYYFGLEGSRVLVQSSNAEFNSTIAKRTNAGKAKIGEIAFVPGSDEETLVFINRFRREYYGIEVPYSLTDGSSAAKKKEEEKKKDEDDGF